MPTAPRGRRASPGLHARPRRPGHGVRPASAGHARVAARARCLQRPRGDDADGQAGGGDRPRPAPAELLDVVQQPVRVGLAKVGPGALDLLCGAVGHPCGRVLALITQLVSDAPDVAGGPDGAFARLGRAPAQLVARAGTGAPHEVAGPLARALLGGAGGLGRLLDGGGRRLLDVRRHRFSFMGPGRAPIRTRWWELPRHVPAEHPPVREMHQRARLSCATCVRQTVKGDIWVTIRTCHRPTAPCSMTDRPAPGAPRRADALRNRERILGAAERLLQQSPSATLADVAAAAGVSRSTVYRRFADRTRMIAAVAERPQRSAPEEIHDLLSPGTSDASVPSASTPSRSSTSSPRPCCRSSWWPRPSASPGCRSRSTCSTSMGPTCCTSRDRSGSRDQIEAPLAVGPELDADGLSDLRQQLAGFPGRRPSRCGFGGARSA